MLLDDIYKFREEYLFTGTEYYNYIKRLDLENINLTWYQKLYLIYYEHFKIILTITIFLISLYLIRFYYNFINYKFTTNSKNYKTNTTQKGGKFGMGALKTKMKMQTTKLKQDAKNKISNIKAKPGELKDSLKEKGQSLKSNLQGDKLKANVGNLLGTFAQGATGFYKVVFSVMIFFGFGVFIFPSIALLFLGFITVVILKKQIIKIVSI
jgi:hypothetical protein